MKKEFSPEEISALEKAAAVTLTDEQARQSAVRELFKFQERDPFEDFLDHLDEGDTRN